MDFKKIELIGFKSFAEKTNFLIEDSLTGIVGPNGCGKSNIVEALRWCMGETSAKSIRGTEMEDVIFSGTANRASKNIAEVTLSLDNLNNEGPMQFKGIEKINVKRRIQKDKGSKYFINEKEVRARDAQTFFADLSTGAHSPSIIGQGRIGALVTAKPADRRAILEEAAGISGIHARRHESELRLNSAENNLKRADELKRQHEKQLENLQKQAEEASKYKLISSEIKKIESGLYYLKLKDLEKEVKITKEAVSESDDDINGFKIELNHNNNLLEEENLKLKPLRDQNIEIVSKLQRINLELRSLEEQDSRAKEEKEKLIKFQNMIQTDLEREKNIILDSRSNEKRLNEEKNNLIDIEKKYFELEKATEQNFESAAENLKKTQGELEKISKGLLSNNQTKSYVNFLNNTNTKLEKTKSYVLNNKNQKASDELNEVIFSIQSEVEKLSTQKKEGTIQNIDSLTERIKQAQEKYASASSKNQAIKTDAIKRQERIKNIDDEIKNWQNLKFNSEKMSAELNNRIDEIKNDLEKVIKMPESIAIKKGKSMQNSTNTENERDKISEELSNAEKKYNELNRGLKLIQEKITIAREKRAGSQATLEGLEKRKMDLLNRASDDLNIYNISAEKILNASDFNSNEDFPDTLEQEEKLDAKKRQRENLGSVNLRADVETSQLKTTIKKMEEDKKDIVEAIRKLRASINELNQKGRERLLVAFEKVSRKFSDVYTKLFNGGNAKLELVDSDDPLESGLEMLVSPPGKRLQSITLLSGGEQALTALSLIFAVFLTSPAPICILDEVDAPLDDANVTRFCNLLGELIKITRTKFIIVTHHALTMSKMNRLYGITMPEKGVSQLVAVDLDKAEKLVA